MAKMSNRGMTKRFLISEMDRSVRQMLRLIEEEGDSFAKKAEIYYQKRPKLVSHVEDFYRMFRSLAERYNNANAELRRSRTSDVRPPGPILCDICSEPPSAMTSPDHKITRRLSEIPNFDILNKPGYETSNLDSESDSDDSLFTSYSSSSNYRRLRKKIVELESELKKVQMQRKEYRSSSEIAYYQEELRVAKEKIRSLEGEIDKLKIKLKKYEPIEPGRDDLSDESPEDFVTPRLEQANRIPTLQETIAGAGEEVKRFRRELDSTGRLLENLEPSSDCEKQVLSEGSSPLQPQVTRLSKERLLDDNIREWERCRRLEENLERMGLQKAEMEDEIEQLKMDRDGFMARVNELEEETSLKDDQMDEMNERLEKLHSEYQKSINSIEELRYQSRELEKGIEKQQKMIEEGAEENRQAVRQLCFSLEHYRNAYQMLRQDLLEQKKPVMAS